MDLTDRERPLRSDKTSAAQTCNGECFNAFILPVQPQALVVVPSERGHPPRSLQKRTVYDLQALYEPLLSSQTRLLRILPQDTSSIARVQLVVADLIATEGLRLVDTKEDVSYTALSYCWQTRNDESDGIIVCNDLLISQPANIIAAIKFHRAASTTPYLWIDAICINQDDLKEKANQIGIMLDIYHKAAQVTAWLGEPDRSSDQAINCVRARERMLAVLDAEPLIKHTSQCLNGLRLLHDALLDFFDRPYWQRTWIRQETFAARKIIAVCGETQLDWLSFLQGAGMIRLMNRSLFEPSARSTISIPERDMKVQVLLKEAQRNWDNRTESWPQPRDLLQLLMSSKWYGVTVESDTVYALLRMAGVPITTNEFYRPEFAFPIDYERTVEDIYRDLSLLLLRKYGYPAWWNFYVKPAGETSPKWVMHWRYSKCEDIDMIRHDKFAKTGRIYGEEHIARTARWYPLLDSEHSVTVHNEDQRVLVAPARALNYVAYLTDYSCSVDRFMELNGDPLDNSPLGPASELIHYRSSPVEGEVLFSFPPETKLEPFDRIRHDRRIAVLGCALDWQFALVPAMTRKGDLIIGITSELLPMVITPRQETHHNDFYQSPDLHETCPLTGTIKTVARPWFFRNKRCSKRWIMRNFKLLWLLFWSVLSGAVGLIMMLVAVTLPPIDFRLTFGGLAYFVLGMLGIVLYFIPRIRYPYLEVIKPHIEIRNRNFAILDKITQERGANYDFVGPVLVRQGGPFMKNHRSPIKQPSDRAVDRPVQTFYIH